MPEQRTCQLKLQVEVLHRDLEAYGVSGDMDVLLLAICNQVVLSQKRVAFDLVHCWGHTCSLDDGFKLN